MILECDSRSEPEWFINSVPWPPEPSPLYHKYARTIIIDEVKQHDYGLYKCLGTSLDEDGQENEMMTTILLLVGGILMWLDK